MGEQVKNLSNNERTETKKGFRTVDLAYMGLFVALMAVCSWINIPTTVPFTLQTFAIFAAVAILGLLRGTIAVIAYILLGLVGAPVFAGFSGGPSALFGTTGGYIIGFIFTAVITGGIIKVFGKKVWVMVIAMVLGLIACYAFGTAWFMFVYARDVEAIGLVTALGWCVFPFIIPDCIKIVMAIVLEKSVGRYIHL